ncbi:MAG: nickel-dependent lactate racemase [Thiotrichales bacterium]|nr:nickel-dependent lactate racemase [Thiotrichales bacterium]
MIVELEYGRGRLPVRLPDTCEVTVLRKRPLPVVEDADGVVERALVEPIGAPPLARLAHGRGSACILVCDITRPVPNHIFLRPMIHTLLDSGIPASNITVLVATGLHRPNEGEELAELIGDRWVLDTVRVENHFARDDAAHVDLGVTATRGTPVKLDRRFVDADLRIATGLVEPHFMAGWSGGRKVVAPGVAHEDTIRTFHNARFMENPAAIQCNLGRNPLHEEQLEIIRMLGEVHAVNTVIDEQRRLCFVNFGEIVESHLQAVRFVHDSCVLPVDRKFRTVVTSAAGYPLDRTYYQTVKGMVTPIDILAPDANLIVASDCSEGLGSPQYRESQRQLVANGPDGFLAGILDKPLADIDAWQTEMLLKPMRLAGIHLYSQGLPPGDRELTGVNVVDSIEDAVARSVETSGDPAVAVIPEGPYVVPRFTAPAVVSL